MVKCPRCGIEGEPTGKEWKFGVFDAKALHCSHCDKPFNAYYRDGTFRYTLPKPAKK